MIGGTQKSPLGEGSERHDPPLLSSMISQLILCCQVFSLGGSVLIYYGNDFLEGCR